MLWLKIAGILNFIAAALHIAVILGGEKWYRAFGAGEHMAQMAKNGIIYPAIITTFIALILFICGLYAWSAAGVIYELPLIKPVLIAVCTIYLIRGAFIFLLPFFPTQQSTFNFWSSLIVLVIGFIHLAGILKYFQQ
jgi:hypothetical protein